MTIRLAVLLFLFSICASAQKKETPKIVFLPGYIVNEKGDTLKGEVKYNPKKEQDCYSKVFFKDQAGTQKNYKPKKVKAYGFDGKHFMAMEFENELKYYRVLTTGSINFYKIMYEMISMNQPVIGAVYYISHKDDSKLKEVKEGKFKKQMTEWMKDNTEFLNNYEDEKEFNVESATEVIRQYNAWKAGQ